MKIIDVHPDDLLDREIEGTLSGDERRRLRDHLERCMQCRLERQLRSDFEEEQSAVEDARDIQSFVSGALRAARAPAAERPRRKAASSTWHRRLVFMLAATMVLATGLAAAEVEFAGHRWSGLREKIAFVFRSPPRESPAIERKESTKAPVLVEPAPAPAPEESNPAPTTLSKTAPVPARRVAFIEPTVALPAALAPMPVPSGEPPGKPRDSASAIFEGASAARRRGNWVEAAELYRDLEVRFPSSPEAWLSIAVVARMQLDLGETAAAAAGFATYLATGDRALREEAMAGRAIALGRLGRAREETEAWRELALAYPSSGYMSLARTRLRQDFP